MMKNVVRATPVAILAAGVFSGQAHATTEAVSGCGFDTTVVGTSNCDVLLGSTLGQSAAQFHIDYDGTFWGPGVVKSDTTFSVNARQTGTVYGLPSSVVGTNWLGFSYSDTAAPVTFQINGANYAGTANFSLSGNIFALDSVDYASTPSVPEPATWAMMILGLGVAGAAARRVRGRQSASATA